jgi:hypothetical protein
MVPEEASAQAPPAVVKQASPLNRTGRRPRPSDSAPPPRCPSAKPTMNRDSVRPASVRDVPRAAGNSANVGALMSTDSAGSAANRPNRTVNANDLGAIRNSG